MKDTDKVIHLNERQNRIMEIMRQQNAVSVATLSSLMKVSEVTIRKDLTMLEEQHMLYRVHGSAILVNRYINDRSVADSSKFGRRGFSKICDMSAVDQIITDDKAPASVIERLQESGVDVTVVPVGRRE